MTNAEIVLHEKIYVAKMLCDKYGATGTPRFRVIFDNIMHWLLRDDERNTSASVWLTILGGKADWGEHMQPILERVLNLPVCPQKYRDDNQTPETIKMKDRDYAVYRKRLTDIENKLLNKYGPLYGPNLKTALERGTLK